MQCIQNEIQIKPNACLVQQQHSADEAGNLPTTWPVEQRQKDT